MVSPATSRAGLYGAIMAVVLGASLLVAGCSGDRPLPVPEISEVTLIPAEGDKVDTILVTWEPVNDGRVEGYAIYRAEEGIGPTPGTKSEFEVEAITIALRYEDDELHVTERYPRTRYYYRIASIPSDGPYGPMSEEASIVYEPTGS